MNFETTVEKIRKDIGVPEAVPAFDPENGNEAARFLFLLEAPGPKAIATTIISMNNPDPTARNFKAQIAAARISKNEIAIWNVVPWYIGTKKSYEKIRSANSTDLERGIAYLPSVLDRMKNLECVVLVGSKARMAHIALSRMTNARILSCHHPSGQSMNGKPGRYKENIDVFCFMSSNC
jgi:uracil-DNA glycosylase